MRKLEVQKRKKFFKTRRFDRKEGGGSLRSTRGSLLEEEEVYT